MVEVGQKYAVHPAFGRMTMDKSGEQIGQVVYIHPQGHYAVLEFDGIDGRPRECFHLDELTKANFAGYGKRKKS
jgi:hypothetical protein